MANTSNIMVNGVSGGAPTQDGEELLQAILHGNLTSVPNPQSRLLKVFVIANKEEFEAERRVLQEVVLPELQRYCSSLGLDVHLVDPHSGNELDASTDPFVFNLLLHEISDCHRSSLGCFCLCLLGGGSSGSCPLPTSMEAPEMEIIRGAALEAGLDVALLDSWYRLNANLVPPAYELHPIRSKFRRFSLRRCSERDVAEGTQDTVQWRDEQEKLVRLLLYGARVAAQEGLIPKQRLEDYCLSAVHRQFRHALGLSKNAPQRILCVVKHIEEPTGEGEGEDIGDSRSVDRTAEDGEGSAYQELLEEVALKLDRANVRYFSVSSDSVGPDPSFLDRFGQEVLGNLKLAVERMTPPAPAWGDFPAPLRAAVQEVVRESQSHLCNCRESLRSLGVSQSLGTDCGPLLQIQELMLGSGDTQRTRHAPVIVCGKQGCGKSTLLSQVLLYCPEWLGSETVRLVRHVGQSPCSMYTSELLRHLCLHISLVFGFEVAPQHYSFELGKLSIWFQDLLKMLEDSGSELVILLDNLHLLRSTPNNQAAILGWLPWNLPLNVHVVCSIAEEAEAVLGLLKSRLADNLVRIPPLHASAAVSMLQSNLKDGKRLLTPDQWQAVKQRLTGHQLHPLHIQLLSQRARRWSSSRRVSEDSIALSCDDLVRSSLDDLEERFGSRTVRKMASYLSCTNFGLRETEMVDLLSSSEYGGEAPPDRQPTLIDVAALRSPDFSITCWLGIKNEMRVLLRESYVDGCPYLHWSHGYVGESVRNRYLSDTEVRGAVHRDLAAAFHQSFLADKEDKGSPVSENGQRGDAIWSDLLRELDELWYHLLMSGDYVRLKRDALCNLDFLMASIRGASVSYIRSILELVRCKVLDWEVELLYSMTKLSVDVLSQDPQQLATEILSWLRPFTDSSSPVLASLVKQAVAWCERRPNSLLVPQNSWLTLTLPAQVASMTCPHVITHMVTTPDSQHVICASPDKTINMYNLPSKSLVRTFKGHKATITCLHLTRSGRWLVSGSEDTDVIAWDVATAVAQNRLSHHIAGVLCVTTTHAESLVLSGSEIGVAIIARLDSGLVVQRMENHRGLISCIAVNSGDDIFATGSADKTVCVWSLEDFCLLNSICLSSSICRMAISGDSTFLLLSCEDNRVHVRSLTTGSDVHALSGHSGTVTALAFARDDCRCVVGCHDGKAYVYDIHSAKRLQVLSGHSETITSAQPQEQDRFLVTAGGCKLVVWSFFSPRKKSQARPLSRQQRMRTAQHKELVTCLAISRDGSLAASGSKDCTVKLWQVATGEISHTLEGHTSPLSCLVFAPNGLFLISGSDDTTLRMWSLPVAMLVATFKEHQARITWCGVTPDSRRILSVDSGGFHRLWLADATASQWSAGIRPSVQVAIHGHWVFAVAGKNENSLRFWPISDPEAEKGVSHSDAILCYTVTYDCQTIVTGSQDMSLKVWELTSGKLTQVLVGHEGPVTCVAVAPFSPSLVVSGSMDCSLIVWDMTTGAETFAFRGHTSAVKALRITLDGSVAISCSDDNTLQLWQTVAGQRLAVLDLHHSLTGIAASVNAGAVGVHLAGSSLLPILRLHNNPGKALKLDLPPATPGTEEAKTPGGAQPWRGVVPKRVLLKGNLKREQSFDSFYWDLRASSPKHDMTSLMDDFKRVPSPFGSREHLHLAGTIWDGNVGRGLLRDLPPSGMKPKLGPKHKQLKKQQSMFACFPEFTNTLTGLAPPPASLAATTPPAILLSPQPLKEGERKEPRIIQQQPTIAEPVDQPTQSSVTPSEQPSSAPPAGQQSAVCQIM